MYLVASGTLEVGIVNSLEFLKDAGAAGGGIEGSEGMCSWLFMGLMLSRAK